MKTEDKNISEINEKLFIDKMQEMGLLVPANNLFKDQNESYRVGFRDGFEQGYKQGRTEKVVEEEEKENIVLTPAIEEDIIRKKIRLKKGERHGTKCWLFDREKRIEYEFQSKQSAEKWLGMSTGYITATLSKGGRIMGKRVDNGTVFEFREEKRE